MDKTFSDSNAFKQGESLVQYSTSIAFRRQAIVLAVKVFLLIGNEATDCMLTVCLQLRRMVEMTKK